MAIRVGINGFGRIGRQVLRAAKQQGVADIDFVAVNDLTDTKTLAHLFKYDSVHRTYRGRRRGAATARSPSTATRSRSSPRRIRRRCRGRISASTSCSSPPAASPTPDGARKHIDGGAKKVIISAPAKGEDITIVLGVNEKKYDRGEAQHHLQRVVHDELPRADGEGRARQLRLRARLDGHDPQLHERPEHPRPAAQGPAPRARGGDVDHSDDDRRREGDVARDPRAQGKDRRHRDPRADARRLVHRSRRRRRQAGHRRGRSTRRSRRRPTAR